MALTYQINAQKFKGGVQAGLLLTQVDGDDFNGYHKMGAIVGGFANIPFEEKKNTTAIGNRLCTKRQSCKDGL